VYPWLRTAGKEFLQNVYLRDRFLWRLPVGSRKVALTFDDGPDPTFTPQMLDLLARMEVKATFFVIGRHVERHPDLAQRIVREGHAIGGHTYEHRVIVSLSEPEIAGELTRCRRTIREATGVDSDWFRPPRGQVDFASVRCVCRLGYRLVHWSKTYGDFRCDGTDRLLDRISRDPVRARDIVLFHDHNPYTVEALARMIPAWRSQGIEFQTV
jgi:peptidoglycan-N-acetylglucosamine deacetylase